MADPVFFVVKKTRQGVKVAAADSFTSDGKYFPIRGNHPLREAIAHVLDVLIIAVRETGSSNPSVLLPRTKKYFLEEAWGTLSVIPGNATLPARIVFKPV